MTNSDESMPPAVGVYWIREEDYPAVRDVLIDGGKLPRAWKDWLKMAEEMEQGLKAYGHVVLRVTIDPKTFPEWCAANGTSPEQRRPQEIRRCGRHRTFWRSGLAGF